MKLSCLRIDHLVPQAPLHCQWREATPCDDMYPILTSICKTDGCSKNACHYILNIEGGKITRLY